MLELELIWYESEDFIIRDIHEKMIDKVAAFLLENCFKTNRIYKALDLTTDEICLNWHTDYIKYILRHECSIIAFDKETGQNILAVGLLMWMTKEWKSWEAAMAFVPENNKFTEFLLFKRSHIIEFAKANPNHVYDSLYISDTYINPEYIQNDNFMQCFYNVIDEVGRHFEMPRLTCVAIEARTQQLYKDLGFDQISALLYSTYKDQDKRHPYVKLRYIGEVRTIYYEKMLEPLVPFEEFHIHKIENRQCAVDIEAITHQMNEAAKVPPPAPLRKMKSQNFT